MNNSIIKNIRDIVEIKSGLVISKTSNTNEDQLTNTNVLMLSTSDFDDNHVLLKNLSPNVTYKDKMEKNFLQNGDILFNAKGRRFFAVLYKGEYERVIASATFLVLKLTDKTLSPEFLTWYLNHPKVMEKFEIKQSTQSTPMISKQELMQVEVQIPPLEQQRTILELEKLIKKEELITKELVALKRQLIDTVNFNYIKNGKN